MHANYTLPRSVAPPKGVHGDVKYLTREGGINSSSYL